MKRTDIARRAAIIATFMLALLLAVAALFWKEASVIIQAYDALFKLIGLGIGPLLALLGFFWGRVDKAELKDLAEKLGQAREAAEAERRAARSAQSVLAGKEERIRTLEGDLAKIADSGRLWKLRPNDPFPRYKGWKLDPAGAKIVTTALFKGGVGKTHLTANFAAYVSEKQKKPVLLIDLDYQGSLSTSVLMAAGIEPTGSSVDALFEETADQGTLVGRRIHLANTGVPAPLNEGNGLARAWLVPADYTLTEVESRLLIERVIHDRPGLDERYRLAHLLLDPGVRRQYAMILIDTPPRMTLGTVNALVASHFYVVPTILDRVSSEAVRPFLTQIKSLESELALDLRLAAIVGTMTRQDQLSGSEPTYRDQILATAQEVLGAEEAHLAARTLPRKVVVTRKDDLAYFLSDQVGLLRDRFYDPLFDELWQRIVSPQNRAT